MTTQNKISGTGPFFCEACGLTRINATLPFQHKCPGQMTNETSWVLQRRDRCHSCSRRTGNSCGEIKKNYPHADADIKTMTRQPAAICPLSRWQQAWEMISPVCPDCGRDSLACVCAGGVVVRGPFTYRNAANPEFVTLEKLQKDVRKLVQMAPPDVTAVAGVARSGMLPASLVAMMLHVPLFTIRQNRNDVIPCGNGWRLGDKKSGGGRVLVVDDTVMTGASLKSISRLVYRTWERVIFSAVYVNPMARRKPDFYSRELNWPHLLEWNLFNSVMSDGCALDFDGILCHDCPPGADDDGEKYRKFLETAKPLYLPRRGIVPLIVTARLEKYRGITQQWLKRHGVRCHRLIMHPAKTLGERQKDDIAAYKARHFVTWAKLRNPNPGPIMFIESDHRQARRIAQLAKRLTVCPSAGVGYWK